MDQISGALTRCKPAAAESKPREPSQLAGSNRQCDMALGPGHGQRVTSDPAWANKICCRRTATVSLAVLEVRN